MIRSTVRDRPHGRRRRHLIRWVVAGPLALALLAGCGGGDPDGSGDAAGPRSADPAAAAAQGGSGDSARAGACDKAVIGVTVCLTWDVRGAATLAGSQSATVSVGTDRSAESCADWLKGDPDGDDGQPQLHLPQSTNSGTGPMTDGLTGTSVQHYTGPGTYGRADLSGEGSPFGLDVDGEDYFAVSGTGATASLVIGADGSGSLEFAGFGPGDPNQEPYPTIAGKVTWTCHNP